MNPIVLIKLRTITISVGLLCLVSNLHAQSLEETQPLSFGTLVVLDNSTSGSVEIDEVGNVSISNHFATIESPQYGVVQLSGFPPNAELFITPIIMQSQLSADIVSPEQFTLSSINTVSSVVINSDGTDEIRVGGEITTSGSGSMNFADADFSASYSLTFNY